MRDLAATSPLAAAAETATRAPARVRVRALRAALALVVASAFLAAVVLTAMAGSRALLRVVWLDAFVHGAAAGMLACLLAWETRARARIAALLAVIAGFVLWWGCVGAGLFRPPAFAVFLVAGAVALAGLCWRVATATSIARKAWLLRLRDALVIPLSVTLTPFMLLASAELVMVLDPYVLAFEDTLGPRFSQLAVDAFKAAPWFGQPALVAYLLLPAGIALAMAALERTRPPLDVLLAFAALTCVGYALYWVFPVVGPRQAFGGYPFAFPPAGGFAVQPLELHLVAPRNGMPSLHTAWSLMIWFVAAGLGWPLRAALRVFAALNIAATMGAEDAHWISDLIVAVPMTVAVCAATMIGTPMRGARAAAIVVGTLTLAAAMGLLRFAIPVFQAAPALSWLFVVATVAPSLAINARLWRTALARRPVQEPRPSWAT